MASHTDAHTIELLEFRRVLSAMGEFCFSEELPAALIRDFAEGPEGFARLAPVLDAFAEAVGMVRRALLKNDARISDRLPSIQSEAAILEKPGFVLELESIARLASFLRAAVAIRSFFLVLEGKARDADGRDRPEGMAFLSSAIVRIPDLKAFSSEIARSVDESGQLREDQIPELRKARMKIGQANAELRKAAQNIVVQKSEYVSSDFTTVRDGRVVIPLRSDFKGRVQGIVHQSSTSGNTLFLEPFELVAFNNASAQAEQEYAMAMHAVLRDLSSRFAAQLPHILEADFALRAIDDLYCRACHSISIDGCGAVRSGTITLRAARHPLLGSKAIPIDIEYETDARLLVISGPNTGGKTVALKTLGLLSLMNQAGMDIPAAPGSGLPVFSGIFADIGDEQSLSSNLSTFSGHIARIASILDSADSESLVLMDELGSGTDPQEGGVLAQAVAEKLVALHCRALVTSHHGTLKALAFSTPGVMNASMEFSDEEMRPTYRVINGVPGQSHALDISLRVGLGSAVVERARNLIEGNDTAVDKLVRDLGRTKAELLETQDELRRKRTELEVRESEIAARDAELRRRESELKREQAREISTFLREARSRVASPLLAAG